jgi:hypothetical protein
MTNAYLSRYLSEWNVQTPRNLKLLKWAYRSVFRTREISRLLQPSADPQAYVYVTNFMET